MAVREQTLKLHQAIKDEFDRLSNIKEYGVEKYSLEYKLNRVAEKYFKSAKTIENIVFNRTHVKYTSEASQISLDL